MYIYIRYTVKTLMSVVVITFLNWSHPLSVFKTTVHYY